SLRPASGIEDESPDRQEIARAAGRPRSFPHPVGPVDGGTRRVIRVEPPGEPDGFDQRCRRPGKRWLASHPVGDPPSRFWSPFIKDLREAFQTRCGSSAMWDPNGAVDHFLSCKKHRRLSFEWTNYRYVSGWINSSKQALDERVLDPFLVRDEWFEIILPSLV